MKCETCGNTDAFSDIQPIFCQMVAPPDAPATTDDDEEGQLTTSVMLIASGYTTRADGQMV